MRIVVAIALDGAVRKCQKKWDTMLGLAEANSLKTNMECQKKWDTLAGEARIARSGSHGARYPGLHTI